MPVTTTYCFYSCGDHAVTIELGKTVNPAVNREVMALFHYLEASGIVGVKDIIPAWNTITVVYDIVVVKKRFPNLIVYTVICKELQKAMDRFTMTAVNETQTINIPVCYDVSLAPDIHLLATLHKLSVDEVMRIHSDKTYRVYMIGFLPGFAYMGTVDERIVTPRRLSPRITVPAGSIGIAGIQTGIYPLDSPGGWQLIGQTPIPMFRINNEKPCYLQPGDEVKFYPISLQEFQKIKYP